MPSARSSTSSAAGSPHAPPSPHNDRAVRLLSVTLGLGALGLAWSLTTTAAYLPPLLERFTSSTTLIALVLAVEGVFAITLPLVIGPWSDTFHTPMGRRRPFMLAAVGPLAFTLALLAFMPSMWTAALIVCAFFFAYYIYEPPYRGLYPDVLPERFFGRAQGIQHLFRGIAIAGALILGGVLFHYWEPAAFILAAGVVVAACLVPVLGVREDGGHGRVFQGIRAYVAHSWHIVVREREIRRFLIANTAWEGTFAGMRTFVVLYVTVGLNEPLSTSTAVLAAVAGGYVIAAVLSGPLGDRYGMTRVIIGASLIYGTGLTVAGVGTSWRSSYLVVIFFVAIAGGAVMTLAWGLLFKLMPPTERGAIAGLATTTKGIGLITGPLAAGAAVDILKPYLRSTEGYAAVWPIVGIPILLVIPLVWSLIKVEDAADRAAGVR